MGIKITFYDATPDIWTKNFVVLAQTTNKLRNHTRLKKSIAFKLKVTLL